MALITKGFVVSMLVFVFIFVGGAVFLYDSEAAMQAVIIAAILISSVVEVIFTERERRGRNRKA